MKCPDCGKVDTFCEDVDLKSGEVTGYHCTTCGYDENCEDDIAQ